jgi:hypothetical protein
MICCRKPWILLSKLLASLDLDKTKGLELENLRQAMPKTRRINACMDDKKCICCSVADGGGEIGVERQKKIGLFHTLFHRPPRWCAKAASFLPPQIPVVLAPGDPSGLGLRENFDSRIDAPNTAKPCRSLTLAIHAIVLVRVSTCVG